MFDHWSILQYLQRGKNAGCNEKAPYPANMTCGDFNVTAIGRSQVLESFWIAIETDDVTSLHPLGRAPN